MRNKKIVGLDLEIGSSPNSSISALYAVYLYDGQNNQETTLRKVNLADINQIIQGFQPDFVVSDNVLEIIGSKQNLDLFLESLPNLTQFVQITYDSNGYQQTLSELAKQSGLNIFNKLNSEKTVELCVYLLIKGHGKIIGKNGNSMLMSEFIHMQESKSEGKNNDEVILMNNIGMRQFPSLISKFSPKSTLVSLIGEGKEAIVGLFEDEVKNYHVIKCFRKYSPVVNGLKPKLYHLHDWDYAIKLAKSEEEHLRIANYHNIATPKVISQSGPFVVMEAITSENGTEIKIAPTLSQTNLRQLGLDPIEFFYQSLDLLMELFSEAKLVHNDYSAQNLLLRGEDIIVIDFSQAEKINLKTFSNTPKRIRVDDALIKVKKDVHTISSYFSKKYRLSIETAQIYKEFVNTIPQKLLDQCDEHLIT
ncbi:MAG: hypothetical protein GPJ54_22075 [Candidatus Heimdallarchaeota archaeon]|nr:hypothetical protein [Candidatus Heimdallarchaeota archaeon]